MNNNARAEPETKLLLEILGGGFRVLSLGQVGLSLWMTQARQLSPNDPQLGPPRQVRSGGTHTVPSQWLLWGTSTET